MTFRVICRKEIIYKNSTSPLCLLFFQGKRKKAVGLGVSVALKHWDAEAQKVTDDCPDRDNIQFQITAKVKEYEKKIRRLEIMDIPVTFENLFEQNSKRLNCSIGEYLKQTIERLETLGKYGSASKHRSLLSRLSEFRSLNTRFDEIDLAFLRDFELFLRKEGNVNNSIATQYAILQCLCIRCHGGLCPLFRTHQNQRKSSNVVVLENPQQRTGKRGAHFGSVPHLFGNGSSRIDALLGLIGLADHRQRFSVSAQLKGVAGAPRLTVAVTARKLRTVDRKIAGIAHKGRSFHLLEDVERPVGQKLDVDIEIRICLVAPLRLAPLAHNARINVFRTVVILRTTG